MVHAHEFHTDSQKETEPPPPPPSMAGAVVLREGETDSVEKPSIADVEAFWPAESTLGRQVVIVTLPDSNEYLAFGTFTPASHPAYCCRTPFVVWGKVGAELELFLKKMEESNAELGVYSEAPVPRLQQYITDNAAHFTGLLAQASLPGVDWEQNASNEENYTRSAA